jgi:hypothetical protein
MVVWIWPVSGILVNKGLKRAGDEGIFLVGFLSSQHLRGCNNGNMVCATLAWLEPGSRKTLSLSVPAGLALK